MAEKASMRSCITPICLLSSSLWAMFVFIGTWSDFLWPLVILDNPSLYTLPLGLQQLSSSFSLDWRIVAAGSVVSILPVLVLFVLLQRFILPNASGDAVKG